MAHIRKIESLSKLMSYILRHRPDEFGLVPDEEGFIPLKELHQAITEEERWSYVRMADIQQAAYAVDSERFEIEGKRIRAGCGHSLPVDTPHQSVVPQKTLYHGTRQKAYPGILQHGLKPIGRRYAPLATSEALALRIGRRRDPSPVLLTINASRAHQDGILFYPVNELIYLVDSLPVQYITGPVLPREKKEREVKKPQENEPEISEYVLFARGLHPGKYRKAKKRQGPSWKVDEKRFRRQKKGPRRHEI